MVILKIFSFSFIFYTLKKVCWKVLVLTKKNNLFKDFFFIEELKKFEKQFIKSVLP